MKSHSAWNFALYCFIPKDLGFIVFPLEGRNLSSAWSLKSRFLLTCHPGSTKEDWKEGPDQTTHISMWLFFSNHLSWFSFFYLFLYMHRGQRNYWKQLTSCTWSMPNELPLSITGWKGPWKICRTRSSFTPLRRSRYRAVISPVRWEQWEVWGLLSCMSSEWYEFIGYILVLLLYWVGLIKKQKWVYFSLFSPKTWIWICIKHTYIHHPSWPQKLKIDFS